MNNLQLLEIIKKRQKQLGIKIENISKLSQVDNKVVQRFFNEKIIKNSELIKITSLIGVDLLGNEVIDINTLKEKRAEERALYIVSLVQDTSSLEMQGLESNQIAILLKEIKEQFLTGEYQQKLWMS